MNRNRDVQTKNMKFRLIIILIFQEKVKVALKKFVKIGRPGYKGKFSLPFYVTDIVTCLI